MRRLLASLGLCALLAACSGAADGVTTTTTTAPPVTATSQVIVPTTTTTTAPPETTTTASPPETTTTEGDPLAPEASGCTPGTDILPDGKWYGGVRVFDEEGISFDLACLYFGEAAEAAAAEDGEEPPPNDYYVRNENEQVRMLSVAPDTPVTWYTSGDPNDEETGTFTQWVEWLSTQESYYGIFVTVEDGNVTEIAEWWTP
jgi:hypothetical protein